MNMMQTLPIVSPQVLIQQWADLAQDEQSPDHYELTEYGEVVLSPRPESEHQILSSEIAFQLRNQLGGMAVVELAVLTTTAGIRVPDVVWMPQERWTQRSRKAILESPDIVVEVLSPGNRQPEMDHKIHGYLHAGVKEVIVVGLTGTIEYIHPDGRHATSIFPLQLKLPAHLFA